MLTKNKELRNKFFDLEDDCELVDEPDFGYEIHICKLSAGWKSLWQSHDHAYRSVSEFEKFVRDYEKELIFYDEYLKLYSIEDFLMRIKYFDRDENGNIREWADGVPLICHEDYGREHRSEYSFMDIRYWQDDDGYDFTERSFS